MQVIGFLNENRETEVLAAPNRLDIAQLNEILVIFGRFIKCVEGKYISYSDIFSMLQKLMVDLGSLRASRHAETLMQTVSEPFSRTTDLNVIFVCCLMTPAGKRITELFSDQAGSRQAWKQRGSRESKYWTKHFPPILLK
jgi:hypothetical protein